jgi:hypothetical protein
VTRQEIEQEMDELAREYHETHDPEIPERFLNWLGSFGRWNIEGAVLGFGRLSIILDNLSRIEQILDTSLALWQKREVLQCLYLLISNTSCFFFFPFRRVFPPALLNQSR